LKALPSRQEDAEQTGAITLPPINALKTLIRPPAIVGFIVPINVHAVD
jgi:hypothetical protein